LPGLPFSSHCFYSPVVPTIREAADRLAVSGMA